MLQKIKNFIKRENGTTAVEFALVAGAFLFIVFGTFEASRVFFTKNVLQYALEQATRYRIVNADATQIELENLILDEMQGMMVSSANLVVNEPVMEDLGGVTFIEMTATYDFETIVPGLDEFFNSSLTARSRMAVGNTEEEE